MKWTFLIKHNKGYFKCSEWMHVITVHPSSEFDVSSYTNKNGIINEINYE